MTEPIQRRPDDTDVDSARLKECLEAFYFAAEIGDVDAMINHIHFLEKQAASLKRSSAGAAAAPNAEYEARASHPEVQYAIDGDVSELPPWSVVIDVDGDAWQRADTGMWGCIVDAPPDSPHLQDIYSPYFVVYIPEGED